MANDDPDSHVEAQRRHRGILPLIVFMRNSIDTFICCGKRIVARRLGIDTVFDRAPCHHPTKFGLLTAQRLSAMPGPF